VGRGTVPTPEWTYDSSNRDLLALKLYNPGPTKAAASADGLVKYLVSTGRAVKTNITWSDNTASGAKIGDVIAYDWDNGRADGIIDHVALVTDLNDQGYPSVTQHSPTQKNRYWSYSEVDHDWIEKLTPGARAYLVHIQ
jgi:hypothetical protein